jgi:hypothetical protein
VGEEAMDSFVMRDCALLTRMSGVPEAANLRELRERVAVCGENVLYHHFCETLLRPSFDYPDYHNDFAVWSKLYLDDRVLAERLGILDPFTLNSMEHLRNTMLDIIDERLSEVPVIRSVSKGSEFFFLEATTVVFDTGDTVKEPGQLPQAVRNMTNGSVFFHFVEARRRTPDCMDDFSTWLTQFGETGEECRDILTSIDFSFLTLSEIRNVVVDRLLESGVADG